MGSALDSGRPGPDSPLGADDGETSVRPMPKLTPDQVNYLNISLMLVAAGLAFWLPFQLFLFVYAVLGPAHYLTQISWLHDRDYFTTGKYDHVFLIGVSVLVTICVFNLVPGAPPAAATVLSRSAMARGSGSLRFERAQDLYPCKCELVHKLSLRSLLALLARNEPEIRYSPLPAKI